MALINKIKIKTKLTLQANDVWKLLQNFSIPHKYIPFLHNTIILGEPYSGLGSTRRVFTNYNYMDETVIKWEEGSGFTVKLHRNKQAPLPFTSATFTYQIRSTDKNYCELIGIFNYELLFGTIGKFLNQLFLRILIRFNIRRVIIGMKEYLNQNIIT